MCYNVDMDGQEYLNQISMQNRPVKKSRFSNFLSSKFAVVGLIGVIALAVVIVIGALIGGDKKDVKNLSASLALHVNNTAEVISEYQTHVKSSELRASAASLGQVLSVTGKDLADYLENKYNLKLSNIGKDISTQANTEKDGLESELFEAKINGILDRIFAHKMSYEISLIATEAAKIIKSTSDTDLKDLVEKNYSSLENLYDKFNNFSEAK